MPRRRASTAHYMLKEIHEQPRAVAHTLEERVAERQAARGRVRPGGDRGVRAHRARAHRRLRHELPRGHAWRGTSSSRSARLPCAVEIASEYRYRNPVVPNELAVRHHLAVRRDGGHARGAAPGEAGGLLSHARDLQRAGELAGARIRARDADARRPGDRRRLDQGVHDAARGARHAGRSRSRKHRTAPTPSASAAWCSA